MSKYTITRPVSLNSTWWFVYIQKRPSHFFTVRHQVPKDWERDVHQDLFVSLFKKKKWSPSIYLIQNDLHTIISEHICLHSAVLHDPHTQKAACCYAQWLCTDIAPHSLVLTSCVLNSMWCIYIVSDRNQKQSPEQEKGGKKVVAGSRQRKWKWQTTDPFTLSRSVISVCW